MSIVTPCAHCYNNYSPSFMPPDYALMAAVAGLTGASVSMTALG